MNEIVISKSCYIASVDGGKCKNKKITLEEIGNALLFPSYYGHNLDALEECLCDLSWIKHETIYLFINNFDLILNEEPLVFKTSFSNLLNDVKCYWLKNGEKRFIIHTLLSIDFA